MKACKFYQSVFRYSPFLSLKDWAVRRHLERCGACNQKLASREELASLLSLANIYPGEELWTRVEAAWDKASATAYRPVSSGLKKRRWILAASSLSLLAALGLFYFFLLRSGPPSRPKATTLTFQILRFYVKDRPATPVIYKPFGSKMIFIWAPSPGNNP